MKSGIKQYVVYITHYKGDKLPPWYIGSSNNENVLKGYNGTVLSKKYKEIYKLEQKENKHLFRTRILSYHCIRVDAMTEELRLQKKHNVVKNEKYFNESYATVTGFFGRDVSGENHPMYGRNHSDESKELISKNHYDCSGENNSMFGKKHSQEVKDTISKANTGLKRTEEFKLNVSLKNTGKKRTDETKRKLSECNKGAKNYFSKLIYIYNEHNEIMFKCHGNIKVIIKDNDIPDIIKETYRDKNVLGDTNKSLNNLIKNDKLYYLGWYARIINKETLCIE